MRLLIIEDEPDMLDTLAEALRGEGDAVDEALDGENGLFKAIEVDYDAIICDVMLPVYDGFEGATAVETGEKDAGPHAHRPHAGARSKRCRNGWRHGLSRRVPARPPKSLSFRRCAAFGGRERRAT